MKYFYMFGNICSIVGLVASIGQLNSTNGNLTLGRWIIITLVVLTIIFWLYFYFKPSNPIVKIINSRIDFTGEYHDSKNQNQTKNIYEGEFEVSTSKWQTIVPLPPFEEPPIIRPLSCDSNEECPLPEINNVTEDSFTAKIHSSTQSGKWKFRARGKLMKKVENSEVKK